jgi:uncharacterized membrane protein YphA (DoxX/SURF4 family)
MKITSWIVKVLLVLAFIASGSMKLFAFDQLAASAPALADQRALVTFIGIAELAGGIGLIVPALTRIFPVLTTWAALAWRPSCSLLPASTFFAGRSPTQS